MTKKEKWIESLLKNQKKEMQKIKLEQEKPNREKQRTRIKNLKIGISIIHVVLPYVLVAGITFTGYKRLQERTTSITPTITTIVTDEKQEEALLFYSKWILGENGLYHRTITYYCLPEEKSQERIEDVFKTGNIPPSLQIKEIKKEYAHYPFIREKENESYLEAIIYKEETNSYEKRSNRPRSNVKNVWTSFGIFSSLELLTYYIRKKSNYVWRNRIEEIDREEQKKSSVILTKRLEIQKENEKRLGKESNL